MAEKNNQRIGVIEQCNVTIAVTGERFFWGKITASKHTGKTEHNTYNEGGQGYDNHDRMTHNHLYTILYFFQRNPIN